MITSFEALEFDLDASFAIIAHRGVWNNHPENSLAALQAAIDAHADFVEVDVRMAKDGRFVCIHDATLDRTTSASGNVSDWDSSELTKLALRASDGGADHGLTDQRLPDLELFCERASGRVLLDVDVKVCHQLTAVVEAIVAFGASDFSAPKAAINSRSKLQDISELSARTGVQIKPIMTVSSESIDQQLTWLDECRPLMVECLFQDEDTLFRFMEHVDSWGMRVNINTLDTVSMGSFYDSNCVKHPDATWGAYIRNGIKMIQTDRVEALASYRANLAKVPR